jgi:DNA-binding XRE family transcriptional regulator
MCYKPSMINGLRTIRVTLDPEHVGLLFGLLRAMEERLRATVGVTTHLTPSEVIAGLIAQAAAVEGVTVPKAMARRLETDAAPRKRTSRTTPAAAREPDPAARKFHERRTKEGLSQAEAGALFGLAQPTVALIESGTRAVPARLRELVWRWGDGGKPPTKGELEQGKRRTAWDLILAADDFGGSRKKKK